MEQNPFLSTVVGQLQNISIQDLSELVFEIICDLRRRDERARDLRATSDLPGADSIGGRDTDSERWSSEDSRADSREVEDEF